MELFDKLGLSIPDRFVAVVTKGAETTMWHVFQNWVSDNCEVEPESIPIDDRLPISSRVEVPRRCQTVLMR